MRKLIAIEVYELDDGTIRAHGWGTELLEVDRQLDARASLEAQAALAKVSPTFSAELEATTHFVANLERMTAEITDRLTIDEIGGDEMKLPQ